MKNPPSLRSRQRKGTRLSVDGRLTARMSWPLLFVFVFISFAILNLTYDVPSGSAATDEQAAQPPPGLPIVGTPISEALESGFQLYFPVIDGADSAPESTDPTQSNAQASATPTATWAVEPTAAATLSSTPLPTAAQSDATPAPQNTAQSTPQNGSAIIPPTPDPVTAQCNSKLVGADPLNQIQTVEEDLTCVEPFVDLLLVDPMSHMGAFYGLITSTVTTDHLWEVSYEMARRGEFRTTPAGVEDLWENLADAIANCKDAYRCPDWAAHFLPLLTYGDMYQCPALGALSAAEMVESVPYGDYYCTEDTATSLVGVVDEASVNRLVDMGTKLEQGWSRRNVLRVLGRLAQQPSNSSAHVMVTETVGEPVLTLMLDRLAAEENIHVLNDAIWVVDTYYFPTNEAQPFLEILSTKGEYDSTLRFRAMGAISRLIDHKQELSEADLAFLESSLLSDDGWVRAQAAFTFQLLEDVLPATEVGDDPESTPEDSEERAGEEEDGSVGQRGYVVALLQTAYDAESEFMAKASLAQALDLYNGTDLRAELQNVYEDEHLTNASTFNHITIRSGLPQEELPAFMLNMRQTESTFFDVLGAPFDTPVPNDPTDAMTLFLFATRDKYREYMNAFVGYGAEAGGLYLESWGKLYTYQREPGESAYTVEHLIQHEFTHYLQGRYVFPELWTDPGYHTEPKGWLDEGTAEFFGMIEVNGSSPANAGSTTFPISALHLNNICGGNSYASLSALINRRAGYDQPGIFDYDNGWALVYYLLTEQKKIALNVYSAMRDGSYRVANFGTITSMPVSELEFRWHQAMSGWCSDDSMVRAASSHHGDIHSTEVVYVVKDDTTPQPPVAAPQEQEGQVVRLVGE